jgi:hypothetical protein
MLLPWLIRNWASILTQLFVLVSAKSAAETVVSNKVPTKEESGTFFYPDPFICLEKPTKTTHWNRRDG